MPAVMKRRTKSYFRKYLGAAAHDEISDLFISQFMISQDQENQSVALVIYALTL